MRVSFPKSPGEAVCPYTERSVLKWEIASYVGMDHRFHASDRGMPSSGRAFCIRLGTLNFVLHALGNQWRVLSRRVRGQICISSKSKMNGLEGNTSEMRYNMVDLLNNWTHLLVKTLARTTYFITAHNTPHGLATILQSHFLSYSLLLTVL